jgi:Holliday junction resolvase-like predicted endonuclease
VTNHKSGHDAEKVAAEYLVDHGYKVVELNWKTRYCEIDIVAQKDNRIYFVEVKSRRTLFQGSGMDYITRKKLSQMRFAAEMWVSEHNWTGDYQLAAISIAAGQIDFVEIDT